MIHPTAIVDPSARLHESVEVGPWTWIGPDVEIDEGTVIESHVVIKGPTRIGARNHIFQFSTSGDATPDLKYKNEPTELHIGDDNVIRENVTIHRGTIQDRALTIVGNHNLLMAYVHIGHDCVVGDNVILVNNTALAGHVVVGDWAILSGYTLVHQFCKIGAHSFSGAGARVGKDIPAFVTVVGSPAEAKTINSEGLRRRGFSTAEIAELRRAFKILYRQGHTLDMAIERLTSMVPETPSIQILIDSLRQSERGIIR